MTFSIDQKAQEDREVHIIHRTSCVFLSDSGEFLGEHLTYEDALLEANKRGYVKLNGCYWCCFWNHRTS